VSFAAQSLGLVLLASPAVPADWYDVLWPSENVELATDGRLFALLAVLNACGLDQGPVVRSRPVPRVAYSTLRGLVRARGRGAEPSLKDALEAYLDAHPVPVEGYLAVSLGASAELPGLQVLLDRAWTEWRLGELAAESAPEQRAALLAWVPLVQGPLRQALGLLKAPGRPLRLVSSPLDAPGAVRSLVDQQGRLVLVVGPVDGRSAEELIRHVASSELTPLVGRHMQGWTRGAMVLREARMDGSTEQTLPQLATGLLSQVVVARALGRDAGPAGSTLDAARSLEGWVVDALPMLAPRQPRVP
jgi:hypothetical protein